MTPKASENGRATGKSFKGVFQYLLHDKRLEGEDIRTTTERFEWAAFRNLVTDTPDLAYRIMAATAAQQDELKRQAGSSVAGNKSDQVVFHYSLGWHPDEKDTLSQGEMLRAADQSIAALGAEGHQAAIIAHNDTKHPHVHVVINRVNPEHGKMLDLWKYQERLSKWALGYEQERGMIYCEQRAENWERRDLGETFSAEKDTAYHLRHDQNGLGSANDTDSAKIIADQKAKDAALAKDGEAMHQRHSQEWKDLSAWYAAGKDKIAGRNHPDRPTPFQQVAHDVKAQFKPLRSQLDRQHWHEVKDFEKRENRLLGKLENAVAAVKVARELAKELGGAQSSLFNHITSSAARKATLETLHRAQWRQLNGQQKAAIGEALSKVKQDQAQAYTAHRARFKAKRAALKLDQAKERQDLRQKWHTRKIERTRAFDIARTAQTLKTEVQATPEPTRGQIRAEFNKVRRQGRKRKGRVRRRGKE